MDVFNLFDGATETPADPNDPPGYACSAVRVGPKIGASKLGMSIYELPAGQAICPYHFEWTDEEWLIVIAGRPTLRSPEGERGLEPGDMVCFPLGPDGAHFVRNGGGEPVRVAIFSTKNDVGIAEYPDSDKVGVWQTGRTTCFVEPITSTTGTASAKWMHCDLFGWWVQLRHYDHQQVRADASDITTVGVLLLPRHDGGRVFDTTMIAAWQPRVLRRRTGACCARTGRRTPTERSQRLRLVCSITVPSQ